MLQPSRKAGSKAIKGHCKTGSNAYLIWLLESPEGRAEAKAQNNHGSWYDVQVASYALLHRSKRACQESLNASSRRERITKQIAPDGRQPRELERSQAWNYSLFNLEALFDAASIADKLGMDLWNYETQDKRGIRKALDWLLPFATGATEVELSTDLRLGSRKNSRHFWRRAALQYREMSYENALSKLPGVIADQRFNLLYPKPVATDPIIFEIVTHALLLRRRNRHVSQVKM